MGSRIACARGGRLRRLRAHPRGARGRRRPRRPRARGSARRRRRRVPARCRATRRSRGCSTRRAATRRTPETPTSGSRTKATPRGSPTSSRDDGPTVVYFGKLIHNKGVHLLLEALEGLDAKAVIVGFGDYREELEADRARADALHRRARAPASRRTCCRCATSRSCRRSSRRPSAWSRPRPPPRACPPIVARHSGLAEVAEGLEAEYPPERVAARRRSRTATSPSCTTSSRSCSRSRPSSARRSAWRRAGPSSRAGAGRAWRNGFSRQ